MIPKHRQVPMSTKVFFGLGMLAMQMFPAALGVFMVVLVQDFGFDPLMWGLIFFLPRVVDAITDPIMGFISDNTRSQWGRRRQYWQNERRKQNKLCRIEKKNIYLFQALTREIIALNTYKKSPKTY